MAKFGIALGSGPRGHGFESRHSDQKKKITVMVIFFFLLQRQISAVSCFFIYSRIGIRTHLGEAEQNRCRRQSEATAVESRHSDQKKKITVMVLFFFLLQRQISAVSCLSRTNCEGPGIEYDRCRWQMKGVRNGAAVKIGSEVTSVADFGHRKR